MDMHPPLAPTPAPARAFAEELLRASFVLSGLFADLGEECRAGGALGPDGGVVLLDLAAGSIAAGLEPVGGVDLDLASELVRRAIAAILADLAAAVELARRDAAVAA
jgi:hypothetical protein